MTQDVHTVENMTARSAFVRLATTNPEPDAFLKALTYGPFAAYGAFATALYVPDDTGDSLRLLGQHGFGPSLWTYADVPLTIDFPLVRAYLTGEAMVIPPDSGQGNVIVATAMGAVLSDLARDRGAVTVVAMPLQYQGVAIGASVWLCTHLGPWTWNDSSYIDGTAAIVSLWLQLRTFARALEATDAQSRRLVVRPHLLTERQLTVLALIRDGKSNAAIAASLGYSISTVKNDVQALFTVLGATRRRELVRRALDAGLLTGASDAAR